MKIVNKLLKGLLKKCGYIVPYTAPEHSKIEKIIEFAFLFLTIAYYGITMKCLVDSNVNIWGILGWLSSILVVLFEDILKAVHGHFFVQRENRDLDINKYIFLTHVYFVPPLINVPFGLIASIQCLISSSRTLMLLSTGLVAIRAVIKWLANMFGAEDIWNKAEE